MRLSIYLFCVLARSLIRNRVGALYEPDDRYVNLFTLVAGLCEPTVPVGDIIMRVIETQWFKLEPVCLDLPNPIKTQFPFRLVKIWIDIWEMREIQADLGTIVTIRWISTNLIFEGDPRHLCSVLNAARHFLTFFLRGNFCRMTYPDLRTLISEMVSQVFRITSSLILFDYIFLTIK